MRAHLSAIAVSAAVLAGCATSGELALTEEEEALAAELQARSIVPATADERAAIANQDLLTQAGFWAEAYDLNPGDREAALQLSIVLRKLNGAPRAADIARQALALYPDDAELQAAYGMALVASGRGAAAVEPLTRATTTNPGDWRLLNALGVALEQSGRQDLARGRFQQALAVSNGEPSVLNNLALSLMLGGDPESAESYLRQAANRETAGPEIRQNLAMAIALQGRFAEAEEIALIDSTPDMAQQNLDYIRALMSSPRSYDRLRRAEMEALR
jgi:Flp pilus assembly protein TadD